MENIIIFEDFDKSSDPIHTEIGIKIIHILMQTQIFHWQTLNYGDHKKFDDFIDEIHEKGDKLVEVISGIYGRINLPSDLNIPLRNLIDLEPNGFINQAIDIFNVYKENVVSEHQEVVSLIDDIIATFQQLKYLLSFN